MKTTKKRNSQIMTMMALMEDRLQFLRENHKEQGYMSVSAYVRALIDKERKRLGKYKDTVVIHK